VLINL